MHPEVQKFQEAAAKHLRGRKGLSARYSRPLRAMAVEYVMKRKSEGGSLRQAAKTLGISENSIHRWMKEVVPQTPRFKPVDIVPDAPANKEVKKPVLITSRGHRVEGLDIDGMAALLRILP